MDNILVGSVLLPPSPNWFHCTAVDSRPDDRLLVAAAFRTVLVFRVQPSATLPVLLKSIPHTSGKASHVRIFPRPHHPQHGRQVAVTGEYGTVTLYDAETGDVVAQHAQHKGFTIGGVCWSTLEADGDSTVVTVDSGCSMVVWSVSGNLTRRHNLAPLSTTHHHQHQHQHQSPTVPNLTLVEAVPGGGGKVVVAAEKNLLVVDVKSGAVLSILRGHDHPVYCLRWYPGPGSPLTSAPAPNIRAQALARDTTYKDSNVSSSCSSSTNWRDRSSVSHASELVPRASSDASGSPLDVNPSVDSSGGGGGGGGGSGSGVTDTTAAEERLFFASSDTGRNILIWDFEQKRYIAKTAVSAGGGKKAPQNNRFGRPMIQHVALAWYGSQLISNNASGEVIAITMWGGSGGGGNSSDTTNSSFGSSAGINSAGNNANETSVEGTMQNDTGVESVLNSSVGSSTRCIHREHNRVVYTIDVFGSTVVTTSQDRSIVGYCMNSHKVSFNLPTLGATVNTLGFCPHDASCLALGLQENCIKILNLHSSPPIRSKNVYNTIKGKLMALSWHPVDEGHILFGTGDGQVGTADVNTGRVTTFSYYHQKSVYKVEWAPPVLRNGNQTTTAGLPLYAYSFGDREIVMRNPKDPMADPVKLHKMNDALPKDITEFSFSHDCKYLAIGCHDGNIVIVRGNDLTILVQLVFVRKAIQHLLWKPKNSNSQGCETANNMNAQDYTLTISSSDSKICIMDLNFILQQQEQQDLKAGGSTDTESTEQDGSSASKSETEIHVLSSCTRELSGHVSRVVWLSYSPHNSNLLASASYDHTCQIWDTTTGEHLGNYRGHLTRVFRVEFSPNEAGLLYSFAEENSLHQWRISDLKEKSPPHKIFKLSDLKQKIVPSHQSKSSTIQEDKLTSVSISKTTNQGVSGTIPISVTSNSNSNTGSSTSSRKVPSHKSLFPLLHSATSHKSNFLLFNLLCLDEQMKKLEEDNQGEKLDEEKNLEDLLEELDQTKPDNSAQEPSPAASASSHYKTVLARHGAWLFDGAEVEQPPPLEDVETVLDFFGPPHLCTAFLKKQIINHEDTAASHLSTSSSNVSGITAAGVGGGTGVRAAGAGAVLHAWVRDLEQHVRESAAARTLTAHLVAQAPQVSFQLWELASESYAHQLADAGDPLLASCYFCNVNKVTEAVQTLLKHRLPREALALAKARLPYEAELHSTVARAFAATAQYEGNYSLAALLFCSTGDRVSAAAALCRRAGDPPSLLSAGLLYAGVGNALATPTLLAACRDAAAKQTLRDEMMQVVVAAAPELKWFRVVAECQRCLLQDLAEVRRATTGSTATASTATLTNASTTVGASTASPNTTRCGDDNKQQCLVERVLQCWVKQDFDETSYFPTCYDQLMKHLNTSQLPASLKQFWFLISVELSKLLLATKMLEGERKSNDMSAAAELHMLSLLRLACDWGKTEQVTLITHLLLPQGPDDVPTTLAPLLGVTSTRSKCSSLLARLYHTTDLTEKLTNWDAAASTAADTVADSATTDVDTKSASATAEEEERIVAVGGDHNKQEAPGFSKDLKQDKEQRIMNVNPEESQVEDQLNEKGNDKEEEFESELQEINKQPLKDEPQIVKQTQVEELKMNGTAADIDESALRRNSTEQTKLESDVIDVVDHIVEEVSNEMTKVSIHSNTKVDLHISGIVATLLSLIKTLPEDCLLHPRPRLFELEVFAHPLKFVEATLARLQAAGAPEHSLDVIKTALTENKKKMLP